MDYMHEQVYLVSLILFRWQTFDWICKHRCESCVCVCVCVHIINIHINTWYMCVNMNA